MAVKNRTELLVVRLKPEEKERVIHAADAQSSATVGLHPGSYRSCSEG
jgi:hypothetical protein